MLILAIGVLSTLSPGVSVPGWLSQVLWALLVPCAVVSSFIYSRHNVRIETLVPLAMAAALLMITIGGGYRCLPIFRRGLCKSPAQVSRYYNWDTALVNADTYSFVQSYNSTSLRPPLYHFFTQAASGWRRTPEQMVAAVRAVLSEPAPVLGLVSSKTHPALASIARAQQIFLLLSCLLFVVAFRGLSSMVLPAIAILVLYDGGYLTHWFFARAIESKTVYLAFFISVAALSLMAIRYPRTRRLIASATAVAGMILRAHKGSWDSVPLAAAASCDIGRYIKSPRCEVACPVGGGCDRAGLRPWPGRCHLCGGQ